MSESFGTVPAREKPPLTQLEDAMRRRAEFAPAKMNSRDKNTDSRQSADLKKNDKEISELLGTLGWKGRPENIVKRGRGWGLDDEILKNVLLGQGLKDKEASDIIFSLEKRKK